MATKLNFKVAIGFTTLHLTLWIVLFAVREPIPRDYLRNDPTVITGSSVEFNWVSDRGTLMFRRAYGGWPESTVVRGILFMDSPALMAAVAAENIVDWSTRFNEYQLSLVMGGSFVVASSSQWFLLGWFVGKLRHRTHIQSRKEAV